MNKNGLKIFKAIFKNRWSVFFVLNFLVLAVFLSILIFGFEFYYKNKIYPGVKASNIDLSGKSRNQALKQLREISEQIMSDGIFFKYRDKEVVIGSTFIATEDPGLSKEIIFFDCEKTINKAYEYGRKDNFLINLKKQAFILFNHKKIKVNYNLNEKELKKALISNFSILENPGEDARINIKVKRDEFITEVIAEKLGTSFDYDLAIQQAKNNLESFSSVPIEMYMKTDYPKVKIKDAQKAIPLVKKVLSVFPAKLSYKCFIEGGDAHFCDEDFEDIKISNKDLAYWISLSAGNDSLSVKFDEEKIIDYLINIGKDINVPSSDAKFKIKDEKVSEFQSSVNGIKLNIEKTLLEMENKFLIQATSTAFLVVEEEEAKNSIEDANDLGIKELIGVGESNFSKSPNNRRHNIAIGAEALDGLLIKPGEKFSLVNNLGDINAMAGYLPELVIKGNKTVPEYGGGLCQIATTLFRAAINTGLPITERKPHAYRVFYYEPAGTDATVYIPKPDVKFVNDTEKYILIQTKIDGDDLIFEFWGASDGRKVEVSKPKIFNIVSPGPTKIIETEDLDPGVKKCTESSHNGADAEFTREITTADGEVNEEIWSSHYRPWRAVCLVGKEKEEAVDEDNIESENIDPDSDENQPVDEN
ncbi:MAG: VanW family protein [Patescibacteria group bacterium]|nr:VanW family protein [Patescibacteria group bacterium]